MPGPRHSPPTCTRRPTGTRRRRLAAVLVGGLALTAALPPAGARDCLTYLRHLRPVLGLPLPGGDATAVTVDGDLAFLAAGGVLHVLDVSRVDHPAVLGAVDLGPGIAVRDLAAAGGLVHAACGTDGLRVVDARTPHDPWEIGSSGGNIGDLGGMALAGGRLYAAAGDSGLVVLDVSDPAAPFRCGGAGDPGRAADVRLHDGRLLVADRAAGLVVYDLSQPDRPLRLGGTVPFPARAVAADGALAAVVTEENGLRVVDLGDPAAPAVVGSLATPCRAAHLVGGIAVLACGDDGVAVADLTAPATPVLLGGVATWGAATDLAPAGGRVLLADGSGGLAVVAPGLGTGAAPAGGLVLPGEAGSLDVQAGHAYLGCGAAGLQVVELSRPAQPVLVGAADLLGAAGPVAVAATRAYVGTAAAVKVVDITAADDPRLLGGVGLPAVVRDLAVAGEHLFAACADSGLRVLALDAGTTPHVVGSAPTLGAARAVEAAGEVVLLATSAGLEVIGAGVPANPVPLAVLALPGEPRDLAAAGDTAYVAAGAGGLQALNLDRPDDPRPAGALLLPGAAEGVVLSGRFLFVSGPGAELWVVNPDVDGEMRIVGSLTVPGALRGARAVGPYVYLACGEAGLQVAWQMCETPLPAETDPGPEPEPPPEPRLRLTAAYPNPFNPRLDVTYEIDAAGPVRLTVHDLRGRRLRTLVDAVRPAGVHAAAWGGRDARGRDAAAGIYLLRLETSGRLLSRKVALVR